MKIPETAEQAPTRGETEDSEFLIKLSRLKIIVVHLDCCWLNPLFLFNSRTRLYIKPSRVNDVHLLLLQWMNEMKTIILSVLR